MIAVVPSANAQIPTSIHGDPHRDAGLSARMSANAASSCRGCYCRSYDGTLMRAHQGNVIASSPSGTLLSDRWSITLER